MAGPTKKAELRRTEILKGAAECFGDKGVRATSISDICTRLKISPGHLYYYFESKDAIVEALLALDTQRVEEQMREVAQHPDAFDRLLNFVADTAVAKKALFDGSAGWEMYALAMRNARVGALLQRHWCVSDAGTRAIVEAEQRRGRFRADADLDLVVTLLDMYFVTVQLATVADPGFDLQRYQKALRQSLEPYLTRS